MKDTSERVTERLTEAINEPFQKKAAPDPHTTKYLVWSHYHQLKQLKEKGEECRKRGLGYQFTWRRLAQMLSESSGKEISGDYLRKLFYSVRAEYFPEDQYHIPDQSS